MKSIILLSFSLFIGVKSIAQIQVGQSVGTQNPIGIPKPFSKEVLELFKKSTLIFTIQDKDSASLPYFKSEIAKYWTVNNFDVILIKDIDQYLNLPDYSFATFAGLTYSIGTNTGSEAASRMTSRRTGEYAYEIWIPNLRKANKFNERIVLGRFLLIGSLETYQKTNLSEGTYEQFKYEFGIPKGMYKTAVFRNWGYGILGGYLKTINDKIINDKTLAYSDAPLEDEKIIYQLKNDTLFIPDYVNNIRQSAEDASTKDTEQSDDDKDQNYQFAVKYVSIEELNELIRVRTNPTYYLTFNLGSSGKYINIFNSASGKMIYHRYVKMLSFNFKKADIKKISKTIK